MKEATRPLQSDVPTIRTRVLELTDSQGNVCLRLTAGKDGPELTIPADPTVSRETMTTSLRVLTGGSYGAIRPIGERVASLEDLLAIFGTAVQERREGSR